MSDQPEPSSQPFSGHDDEQASRAVDEFTFLAQDVNYDGVLSQDEFDAGRSQHDREADPSRFARYDRNGDGTITREEYLAGMARDRAEAVQGEPR
ncbi:MAG: hypothetical protein VKS61_11285 [Candidatus Sericytochromatia bacterium]|nr:hypothetical protein [Candidatus Sericytochromatia bacterium]